MAPVGPPRRDQQGNGEDQNADRSRALTGSQLNEGTASGSQPLALQHAIAVAAAVRPPGARHES